MRGDTDLEIKGTGEKGKVRLGMKTVRQMVTKQTAE